MAETLIHPSRAAAFAWGYNNSGGLGLGHSARACHPVPAPLPDGTADVQGGGEFTVARTSSGALFAWGGNKFGQLGDGTAKTRLAWTRVPLPDSTVISDMQAGTDHVLALTGRGEVYSWGRNHRGQVGCGPGGDHLTPCRVIDGGAVALGAGNAVSAAITSEGQLLAWGRNGVGQLTVGAAGDVTAPAPALLPPGTRAVAVTAGYGHVVVLTGSNEILTLGADAHGRSLPGKVTLCHTWDVGYNATYDELGFLDLDIDPSTIGGFKGGIDQHGNCYFYASGTDASSQTTSVVGWLPGSGWAAGEVSWQLLQTLDSSSVTVSDYITLYDASHSQNPVGYSLVLTEDHFLNVYAEVYSSDQATPQFGDDPLTDAGSSNVTALLWAWITDAGSGVPGYAFQTANQTWFVAGDGSAPQSVSDQPAAAAHSVAVWTGDLDRPALGARPALVCR